MPKIDINFANVDNVVKPIPTGMYTLEVSSQEMKPDKNGSPMLVVGLKVSDGPQKGRMVTDYIGVQNETRLKRLFASAGLIVMKKDGSSTGGENGLDSEELMGKLVSGEIVPNSFKSKTTGEMVEGVKIKDYLVTYAD